MVEDDGNDKEIVYRYSKIIIDNEEDNFAFDKDIPSSDIDKIQLFVQYLDKAVLLGK